VKKIKINDIEYEVVEDIGDCIDVSEIEYLYTDYFENYDYICGDYYYEKLRLKGFNDKSNKNFNKVNDISTYNKYIEELCSYKAKHFLLKKVNK
jgi:uncharacterized protein YutD